MKTAGVFIREMEWMDAQGTYCHPLEMWAVLPTPAALQRDVDLPEVLCPPPVSANVLDVLQCLTR